MKKTFVFLALLIQTLSFVSTAQTIRFTDTTNRWKTRTTIYPDDEPISSTNIFETADTFHEWNGKLYSVIRMDGTPVLYVREDTSERKVYIAPVLNQVGIFVIADTTGESLYMDFSLVIGDTLTLPIHKNDPNLTDTISKYVVMEIDSVQLGANYYKRMWMNGVSGAGYSTQGNFYVTEGIGFGLGFGLTSPVILTEGSFEWPPRLICFSNNGTVPNPPFYSTCFDPVGIQEQNKNPDDFLVYPNPAHDRIHIALHPDAKNPILDLMDVTGKSLQRHTMQNQSLSLNVESLAAGIYILRLSGDNIKATYRKLKVY